MGHWIQWMIEEKEDGFPADYWEDHKAMLLGDALSNSRKN